MQHLGENQKTLINAVELQNRYEIPYARRTDTSASVVSDHKVVEGVCREYKAPNCKRVSHF